jgi:hypothetical protein
MIHSDTIGSLVGSLAKAQLEIRNPPLDSVNPHFRNRYASLGAHLDAVRIPFANHGLILTQQVENDQGVVTVTTMIAHTSGEWIRSSVGMPLPDRATAQNLGSIVTYLRRYAIGSAVLLTGEEDNDAEEDRNHRKATPVQQQAPIAAPTKSDPPPRSDGLLLALPAKKPITHDASMIFSSTPVEAVASPKSLTKPKSAKKWTSTGNDVVKVLKIVDRGEAIAMLCQHPTLGQSWVSSRPSLAEKVKIETNIELTWEWDEAGFFRATDVREPPNFRDLRTSNGNFETQPIY